MKITLIGAGNLATHLGKALVATGHGIEQVFSQNLLRAHTLREALEANAATNSLQEINQNADLYIVAVPDAAIGPVVETLAECGLGNKLIVHTSGATDIGVFKASNSLLLRYGVFYPLQTFTKTREISLSDVPIFVEANNGEDRQFLLGLANELSSQVFNLDSSDRAKLHLAAVFVNNFVNHLFSLGERIVEETGLPFEILRPLIQETVNKLADGAPEMMQTGPAIRRDTVTIERHLSLLAGHPALQQLYGQLTKSIQNEL
jgi:predicted short-subunit dehydrogenase-like oxidoreductase (DUF2520 family)